MIEFFTNPDSYGVDFATQDPALKVAYRGLTLLPYAVHKVLNTSGEEYAELCTKLLNLRLYNQELAKNPTNVRSNPGNPLFALPVFQTSWECIIKLNPASRTLEVEGTMEVPATVDADKLMQTLPQEYATVVKRFIKDKRPTAYIVLSKVWTPIQQQKLIIRNAKIRAMVEKGDMLDMGKRRREKYDKQVVLNRMQGVKNEPDQKPQPMQMMQMPPPPYNNPPVGLSY